MEVIISLLYKYLRVLTFEITPVGNKKGVRAPRLAQKITHSFTNYLFGR